MAARAKKATSKPTPKKASGKKVVTKKGHRNRRIKTTKGVKRRVKGLKAPPQRKHRRGKKSTAAQKLKAKKARLRLAKLETPADKKFSKGRSKHLRDLRAKRKGKKVGGKKKAVVAGKGKKGHKLNMGAMMRRGRKALGRGASAVGAQVKRLMDAIASLKAKLMGKISAAMRARLEKQIAALETKLADVRKAKAAGKATTKDVLAVKHQLTRKRRKAGMSVGHFGRKATRGGSGGPSMHGNTDAEIS